MSEESVARAVLELRRARRKMLEAANTFRAETINALNSAALLKGLCDHKCSEECCHPERVATSDCDINICPLFDVMENQIVSEIAAFCKEMRGEI